MHYYFVNPVQWHRLFREAGVTKVLQSYYDARTRVFMGFPQVIIDSGAFSVWNIGQTIDIDKYIAFCRTVPDHFIKVSLDVIPQTGSTPAEIDKCSAESFENYKYLLTKLRNVVPVHHYGEDIKWLDKYLDYTDYVGISPANDTHESTKQAYIGECFDRHPKLKAHGFGYTSQPGLLRFPFYSVDSLSFLYLHDKQIRSRGLYWGSNNRVVFFTLQKMKAILAFEKQVTDMWARRGVKW